MFRKLKWTTIIHLCKIYLTYIAARYLESIYDKFTLSCFIKKITAVDTLIGRYYSIEVPFLFTTSWALGRIWNLKYLVKNKIM